MSTPSQHYQRQHDFFVQEAAQLRKQYDRLSYVRLLAFFVLTALIILLWNVNWMMGLLALFLSIPAFAYGIKRHQQLANTANHCEHLAAIAAGESATLAHDFSRFDDGIEFLDPLHPYAGDLDIFGPHTLFQYLNRTVTSAGKQQLANYLLAAAPTDVIQDRQAAITELGENPEWCHEFRARGADLKDDPEYTRRLLAWLNEPELVGNSTLLKAARWFVPLCFVLTIIGLFLLPTWQMALFGLLPVALVMRKFNGEISRQHTFTARAGSSLDHYAALLEQIEATDWDSSLLQELQSPITKGTPPGKAIRQLRYAISQLDVRYNAFSALLELSGLWSVQWLARLEKWKRQHKEQLPEWLSSMAEIDALVSMANLRYNQPDFVQPSIKQDNCYFASQLGHPLLNAKTRVTNDLKMATDGHIHLVTGSNMAGKSTWLRTVGINIVLALAGAPVCAREMQLPQLEVWTSMRTQDALHESTSSFFAELKRLKAIITAVEAKQSSVFFLLDEILKGTNSRDRHTGAKALIRQLIQAKGAGLIATHDLELAEMEKEAGSQVENYAMEVSIKDGQLVFDYKLHRGVSQSFNATVLMAQMGIRIDEKDITLRHE